MEVLVSNPFNYDASYRNQRDSERRATTWKTMTLSMLTDLLRHTDAQMRMSPEVMRHDSEIESMLCSACYVLCWWWIHDINLLVVNADHWLYIYQLRSWKPGMPNENRMRYPSDPWVERRRRHCRHTTQSSLKLKWYIVLSTVFSIFFQSDRRWMNSYISW